MIITRFNLNGKCVIISDMRKKLNKVIAKLNRNNNHKHSDKRKHLRHKDGR